MATEYGLFSDEGLVEGGFYSEVDASAAIVDRYADGLEVKEVCHDHPEQARETCEECNAEEPELAFGLEVDQLTQPFCACGHVISNCDGSRARCKKPERPC